MENVISTKQQLIFYAEDDAEDRLLMSLAFQKCSLNIRLKMFEDGVALLRHLASEPDRTLLPGLIVLDINMPMLSGKDTLRIIRGIDYLKSTPVVLFTTSSTPEDKFFAKAFNSSFITKPLHLDDMGTVLATFYNISAGRMEKG